MNTTIKLSDFEQQRSDLYKLIDRGLSHHEAWRRVVYRWSITSPTACRDLAECGRVYWLRILQDIEDSFEAERAEANQVPA